MEFKSEDRFFKFNAAILLLTAIAKLYSAGGSAKVLHIQDPLFDVSYRSLMILVAVVEFGVAVFMFMIHSDLRRSLVLLWLSANFLCYRVGNHLMAMHICPCLGNFTDRLRLPPGMADTVLLVLVLFWFSWSLNCFWRIWGAERVARISVVCRKALRNPSEGPQGTA